MHVQTRHRVHRGDGLSLESHHASRYESGFSFRVERRDAYVYVHQTHTFTIELELLDLHAAIEREMATARTHRTLFDNRDSDAAPENLRAQMWTWLTTTPLVRRAAVVANSARITRRADRTAHLNRISLQAFHTIEAAEEWLLRG